MTALAPTPADLEFAAKVHPGPAWAHVNDDGEFHRVLIAPGQAVLRIARTARQAALLPRRVALVQALDLLLPFGLPVPLGPVYRDGDVAAVAQRFIPGRAHAPGTGDPGALREIIGALHAVDLSLLAGLLAEPFAYAGPWTPARVEGVLRSLPPDAGRAAEVVLDAVVEFERARRAGTIPTSLAHGDLAGHNLHWESGRLTGILDWDLASAWDPALNVAQLSMWHGRQIIEPVASDDGEAARAQVWRGASVLEVLDARRRAGHTGRARELLATRFDRVRHAADVARSVRLDP